MARCYVLKGVGWEVRISPHGVCDVEQLSPERPVPAAAASLTEVSSMFLIRCLRCGEEILVTTPMAPVCAGCRG